MTSLPAACSRVDAGKLMPQRDRRQFTLETVCEASKALKAGGAGAKLVVEIGRGQAEEDG